MFEKINNFCDRFLNWKVILYIFLGQIVLIPYAIISSVYNLPLLFNIVMILSFNFSIDLMSKAMKIIFEVPIKEEKESL